MPALLKLGIVNGLHHDIGIYGGRFMAFADQQTGIAELVDHPWRTVSCVKNGLQGIFFKYGLMAAGTF